MIFLRQLIVVAALLSGCFTGCQSPRAALEKRDDEIVDALRAEVDRRSRLEERTLAWDEALELLLAHNLELKEARNREIAARENVDRVFLDLLPTINLSATLSKALTDLGSVSSDDLSLTVFGIVSVPGLVNMRTRYYSSVLQRIRSGWATELKERELTIRLYEQFVRQRILNRREFSMRYARLLGEGDPLTDVLQQTPAALERELREWSVTRERDELHADVSRLLGNYDALWVLDADSIPPLGYADREFDLTDVEDYGILVRRLQAVELEGARLTELGVRLQYWPDLNVTLASPPLYQRGGGRTRDWNFDDLRLNLTSSLRLDTQLRTAYRLRDVRRQIEILRERLHQDNSLRLQRLETAARALDIARRRMALTEFRLRALRETPPGAEPGATRDQIESILVLDEQMASLQLEIVRLESIFWLVDDERWRQETL